MHTYTDSDGTLVLAHDSTVWANVLFGLTVLLIAMAGYDYLVGTREWERNRLIGLVGAVVTCGLGGIVTRDQARIRVDPRTRSSSWTFYFQAPGGFTIEVLS